MPKKFKCTVELSFDLEVRDRPEALEYVAEIRQHVKNAQAMFSTMKNPKVETSTKLQPNGPRRVKKAQVIALRPI